MTILVLCRISFSTKTSTAFPEQMQHCQSTHNEGEGSMSAFLQAFYQQGLDNIDQ